MVKQDQSKAELVMQAATATTLQAELKAQHGQFNNGTYVLGVNLQLVTPEDKRPCPVCKTNWVRLWEEVGSPNPKPKWWVCERKKYDDVCVYAFRADDFTHLFNTPEFSGSYDLSGVQLRITQNDLKCPICKSKMIRATEHGGFPWNICSCGFYYPATWQPNAVRTKNLAVKRRNFQEAVRWYTRKLAKSA